MARVLIADDNPDLLAVTSEILSQQQHVVVTVSNGAEAIDELARQDFDVFITDVLMPDKEGIETIMEVRQSHPALPIIAMSGGGHVGPIDYLSMARAAGAHAALTKPVKPAELLYLIAKVLRR